ncbi:MULTISPECIES: hypothetical protein [Pseudomonas]|jgi:hypothetical protein|uniref:Valyl-tRNA synthetase n=2 Tax=Pseudomonas putida TaxID=303 RepID=A0A379KQ69_PSEPU|nr:MULTISPECIES: hypothetical protein [Pseudomonas]MDH1573907.1 hypothetical protein [Pseudomonas sp. GD03746]QQE81827.1 hypothetical protein JET17_14305 [Pseudomonas putida]UTL79114.1 hypothetical protein NL778_13995 [Pseudomonas putida]SUD69537.1 Valyl-tRNA synthetase [Pseudomonas putida]GLH32324.1 hypothetical protein BR1R5_17100 [Pseudomonas sp. BR1R-5]
MRVFLAMVAGCLLATTAFGAQARALSQNDRHVCGWGSQIAAEAQQAKLSGVTLYATRKKLQVRRFAKPWMRMTAFGITEQTYNSRSRLKPAAIKQTYYEQCVQHAVAKR